MALSQPSISPTNTPEKSPLIEVQGVSKRFPIRKGFFNRVVGNVHAVNNVSFSIAPGEILGIVGESGCGKSTLARCILQLIRPSEGRVLFEGQDLTQLSSAQLRPLRRQMQIIFQNPYSSLDPRMTIGDTIAEPFIIHNLKTGPQRSQEVKALLDLVGLPATAVDRFPHELSGGQRQRVGIARALALKPKFIVADEPVSALDVSVQAQILNLLLDLKSQFNLTYLFIAHNLSVVDYLCDRIGVMYLGNLMELGPAHQVYDHPLHPYSQSLISSVPVPDPNHPKQERKLLEGDLPSPTNIPSGCCFHTRCIHQQPPCTNDVPEWVEYRPDQYARCHLTRDINHL